MNRSAVGHGVLAALGIVAPAALANAWLAGRSSPEQALVLLTILALLFGFALGGFAAAREAGPGTPLIHAAAAAGGCWAVLQVVGTAVRLASDDGLSVAAIVFTGLLAASAGVFGGLLANRVADPRTQG